MVDLKSEFAFATNGPTTRIFVSANLGSTRAYDLTFIFEVVERLWVMPSIPYALAFTLSLNTVLKLIFSTRLEFAIALSLIVPVILNLSLALDLALAVPISTVKVSSVFRSGSK